MSPWQQAFTQGYICAVANIVRTHGESVIAKDVLAACPPESWLHVNKDDYDVLKAAGLAPTRLIRKVRSKRATEPQPAEPQ